MIIFNILRKKEILGGFMMESKKMSVNARIIEHLGKDLITSPEIAIIELIKNSLDARSESVFIHIFDNVERINKSSKFKPTVNKAVVDLLPKEYSNRPLMIIEDTGIGMTEKVLEEGFLNIGTSIKLKSRIEDKESKIILGEKGIGRLAAQRLGRVLVVESASEEEEYSNVVIINWEELKNSNAIHKIELPYFRVNKVEKSYTRLWILDIDKNDIINQPKQLNLFKDIKITLKKELEAATCLIVSPFTTEGKIPEIKFYNNDDEIKYNFDKNILNFSESIHNFEFKNDKLKLDLTLTPWYIKRIHRSCISPSSLMNKYIKSNDVYVALFRKYQKRYEQTLKVEVSLDDIVYKIKEIRKKNYLGINDKAALDKYIEKITRDEIKLLSSIAPISGELYSFRLDRLIGNMFVEFIKDIKEDNSYSDYTLDKIKEFLDTFNGVMLYRNYYRIGSMGNKGDDWIQMQQFRNSGQNFFRFGKSNTLGYVSINDPNQEKIREISSRLDMYQNDVVSMFKEFIIIIFNYYFYDFNRKAYFITKSILKEEGLLPEDVKKKVKQSSNINKELIKDNNKLVKDIGVMKELLQKNTNVTGDNVQIKTQTYNKALQVLNIAEKQIGVINEEFGRTQEVLDEAEAGLQAIQIEAFNNYKLMANGLITETITHELHSVINQKYALDMEKHFDKLEEYLLDKDVQLYNKEFIPIKDQSEMLINKVGDISELYTFLERTFIKNNSYEEYISESITEVALSIQKKLLKEFKKNKIELVLSNVNQNWYMPKGVLLHVLYNLFFNSVYWIDYRKKQAYYDTMYKSNNIDQIVIEQATSDSIVIYDTGIGVLNHMEHILFEPLQSGKEKEGRGMGLYIVKNLLSSFGANIELLDDRNKYNHRYKFLISVPEECIR